MADPAVVPQASHPKLEELLRHIVALLEKHRLVETLVERDQTSPRHELIESLVHRQHLVELQRKLSSLHPADVAYLLEALPQEDRLLIWRQIDDERSGDVLLEVSDAVRGSLVEILERSELLRVLGSLDADDLAELADTITEDVLADVSRNLPARDRDWLQTTMAYPEDRVGRLMSQDVLTVRESQRVEQVLRLLRGREDLPPNTDSLFVVDARHQLKGVLPLRALLLNDPERPVGELKLTDPVVFDADEAADDAARAFERYDLISAPVVNERGKLLGRLTVDAVVDFIREESEEDALNRAGLRGDEDLFAPIWDSARNRWLWLSVNLCTAFVASRAIGLFEGTISQIVALATLMPIVAGIGGNSGNQTTALVVRGLALGEITPDNKRYLVLKELGVGLMNGLVWGACVGLFAYLLYWNLPLGLVMAAAMLLNLLLAALVGVAIPLILHRIGRDPALGSSVLLTFITDGMGFFIFLGLATLFLV
ncbi:MAG: magnesium transporter [Candidatus Competibacteraceae bacterium]|nr:magnesium transporter [Candidatus Competibacteraceae bacterium]MBK7982820.1 magnesium transporter [Candidatus Competibacteraceae bacterium]MBK8898633.1 magnesium transporter [Candidatus Competibacteraceae bacterium]MBK8962434.1 magnesium transporter [Candidatus Competibacteraceae bacterium]MBK9951650.1 magnesium transporter [Candidatus Competibacteraceae bacterium]